MVSRLELSVLYPISRYVVNVDSQNRLIMRPDRAKSGEEAKPRN
jgi:hypothetical protein